MANLVSRNVLNQEELAQEAFWNTSKSLFLTSDKDLPKYARQYLDKLNSYTDDINKIEMKLGMTSNLNIGNMQNASKYLNVYITASKLKLEVPAIFTYLKDSSELKAVTLFNATIEELSKVKKRSSDGVWDSLWAQDNIAATLQDMADSISKKIKLTKYEQALIDITPRCRPKFFQRGVATSFQTVRNSLICYYPVEVDEDLLTVATVNTETYLDPKIAAASGAGHILTEVLVDDEKHPYANVGLHGANQIATHTQEKLFLTPYFSVLVNRDDIPLINNYKDTIIAKKDIKVLKDMVSYFDRFVNEITKNYFDDKRILISLATRWERLVMESHISYDGMITLNREVLGKIDQYGKTIENLIKFYKAIL